MSNYLEQLRAAATKMVNDTPTVSYGENEFKPTETPTKIRFLPIPERAGELNYPYVTHSFHYMPGVRDDGKDMKLFVPKKVIQNGIEVEDPIDSFVKKLYDTKGEEERKIAGTIKRKRHFYFNVLVYEEGKDPQLKVLIDTSSEGKLAQRVCSIMGIPFCKSIEDRWFPFKDWRFDEDQMYYDLVSLDTGYDFKVKKSITGNDNWNFHYNDSNPITKGPRALSKSELDLIKGAQDLHTYVKYEKDWNVIDGYLKKFINNQTTSAPVQQPPKSSPALSKAAVADDDISDDDLRAQLLGD
jgi:hypothetical protein